MNKIYMIDGQTIDLPEKRLFKFLAMLTHRGFKSVRFDDTIVFPAQINYIKLGVDDEDDIGRDVEPVSIPEVPEETEEGAGDPEDSREVEPKPEEKPETKQERNDRLLAEMVEKSDCAPKHEGREQILHYQMVNAGGSAKTGKKGVPGRRYFNICSFCGLKQRFIKAATLTDDQKENALLWEPKE